VSRTVTAPPPEVGALARALPDSLPPDVLFGIGGGSGFGRYVPGGSVTLLTRIATRETASEGFLPNICRHLQVPFRLQVAASPDALRRSLETELAQRRTPVVWVEPDLLPWAGPPATQHAVAVLELGGQAVVFDGEERSLPVEALLDATRTASVRHRSLVVDGGHGEVSSALRAGLEAHRQQMREGFGAPQAHPRSGLAGLARWTVELARDVGDGWAETLAAQIERRGGGPAMREAQSAFLAYGGHERAASAASFAATRWGELAAALRTGHAGPDHVRAVHDAEADALATIETALRGR
jgi:hypothetical protein